MSSYNHAFCSLVCPRCLRRVQAEVDLYVGDTSNFATVALGDRYPFRAGLGPKNGGFVAGVLADAGYAECPTCMLDFFCDVEIRDGILHSISPSRTTPPYQADRSANDVHACPHCRSVETRHDEFDNMQVGRFVCAQEGCHFLSVTVLDVESGTYRADGISVFRTMRPA